MLLLLEIKKEEEEMEETVDEEIKEVMLMLELENEDGTRADVVMLVGTVEVEDDSDVDSIVLLVLFIIMVAERSAEVVEEGVVVMFAAEGGLMPLGAGTEPVVLARLESLITELPDAGIAEASAEEMSEAMVGRAELTAAGTVGTTALLGGGAPTAGEGIGSWTSASRAAASRRSRACSPA